MNTREAWEKVIRGLHSIEDWDDYKTKLVDEWDRSARYSYERFKKALPDADGDGFRLTTSAMYAVNDIGTLIERMTEAYTRNDGALFIKLRKRLDDAQKDTRVRPSMNKGSPRQMVRTYLGNTPLRYPFYAQVSVVIPFRKRTAHTWFLAATDTGKTTATMWMIEQDLKLVAERKASIVLVESKGQLTDWLTHHPFFREHPECFVRVDPSDPIAINPLEKRTGTEYEMLGALDFVRYLAANLMGSDFSHNHETVLANCMQLLWKSREPTFDELLKILYDGPLNHRANLGRTRKNVQEWFANEWPKMQERSHEVRSRLYNILTVPAFVEMLGHYKSTFDLTAEMDKGRVIIIHCRKSNLHHMVNHYGRFFFALLERASRDRLDEDYRGPKLHTFAYVDEAGDFIGDDKKIEEMLDQARSQNIGLVLLHQRLGQLSSNLRDALEQAHIKIMRPHAKDEGLARTLFFNGKFNDLPEHYFVLHVEGVIKNGVPFIFPEASKAQISEGEYKELLRNNRERLKPKDDPAFEPKPEKSANPDTSASPPNSDAGVKFRRTKRP